MYTKMVTQDGVEMRLSREWHLTGGVLVGCAVRLYLGVCNPLVLAISADGRLGQS